MDLVLQVKALLKTSLKNRWLHSWALVCAAQASGIGVPGSGWGLDSSWSWVTSQATKEMLFQNKGYIWTYGPLGFLDSIPNDWKLGFILSSFFAISSSLFLFYTTYFLWTKNSKSFNKSIISTFLLTTFISIVTPPSSRIVFGMTALLLLCYLEKNLFKNKVVLQSMALIAAMLFYLKMFPFTVILVIITGLILRPNNLSKLKDFLIFIASLIFFVIAIAIALNFTISGFTFWFSGYMEMLTGYKAMSIEEPGSQWLYLSVAILAIYILNTVRRIPKSKLLLISIIFATLLFFTYGFTRNDISHRQMTFAWLGYLSIVFLHFVRQRIRILISLLLLFTLPFQILQTLDFADRIHGGPVQVVKSIDSGYAEAKVDLDRSDLRNLANLPPQFLNLIQTRTISILPWDQLIAKGYGLNFVTFPIPQPYSAYTPKLDAINAKFVQGESSPDLILLNGPKAIDGRNPIWESPLTNIAILCNYHTVLSDSEYLLLEKNQTSACDYSKNMEDIKSINNADEYIETVEVLDSSNNFSKLKKLFFKQIRPEVLQVNNRDWNFVSANRKYLLLNVPQSLDYPGKWKIGDSNTITKTQTGIRKQLVVVNVENKNIPSRTIK
jgi:hypothetical protein